jgi:hypothetical protein
MAITAALTPMESILGDLTAHSVIIATDTVESHAFLRVL